jgi:DNA repair exonuclease SbcCD ATPase subunit
MRRWQFEELILPLNEVTYVNDVARKLHSRIFRRPTWHEKMSIENTPRILILLLICAFVDSGEQLRGFIDAKNGKDVVNCGHAPTSPCKTLEFLQLQHEKALKLCDVVFQVVDLEDYQPLAELAKTLKSEVVVANQTLVTLKRSARELEEECTEKKQQIEAYEEGLEVRKSELQKVNKEISESQTSQQNLLLDIKDARSVLLSLTTKVKKYEDDLLTKVSLESEISRLGMDVGNLKNEVSSLLLERQHINDEIQNDSLSKFSSLQKMVAAAIEAASRQQLGFSKLYLGGCVVLLPISVVLMGLYYNEKKMRMLVEEREKPMNLSPKKKAF